MMNNQNDHTTQSEETLNETSVGEDLQTADDSLLVENNNLKEQVADMKDKYMRLVAEFDNHRKRVAKERLDLIKQAGQDILSALLPVLDDFDRAQKNIPETPTPFSEGIVLVHNKLQNILKTKGLEVVDTQIGMDFNIDEHEAITEIPAPTDELKGKVVDVVEKGYKLGERIMRYTKVVVGK